MQSIGLLGAAACLVVVAAVDPSPSATVALMTLAVGLLGCCMAGFNCVFQVSFFFSLSAVIFLFVFRKKKIGNRAKLYIAGLRLQQRFEGVHCRPERACV